MSKADESDRTQLEALFSIGAGAHALDELLTRRLVFLMGKGGVGKTTLSVALALTAEMLGKRVLLTEIGDSRGIGRYFDAQPDVRPKQISPAVWIARVDPKDELTAYLHFHMKSGFIANRITQSRLFDYLLAATPGLKEIMTLARIWRWEKAKNAGGAPNYDIIIVDAPATGHGLSLLRLPQMLVEMIRVGPIAAQVNAVQKMLLDRERTALTLVTLPEELPVNETREMIAIAADEVGISVQAVFINGVHPVFITPDEFSKIREVDRNCADADADCADLRFAVDVARRQIVRNAAQQIQIGQVREAAPGHVIHIPYYFTNDLGEEEIRKIASSLRRQISDAPHGDGR